MCRETQTKVLFLATFAGAGLLYWTTAADGYPWSASTHWALAWSGVLPELPRRLWPVWGYFVRVFDGHYIAMSAAAAAFAAALLATVAVRHFGWRVASALALFFTFSPVVWNAAATGGRLASLLSVGALALTLADAWGRRAVERFRRRAARTVSQDETLASADGDAGKRKVARIAAWTLLGLSVVFALASATFHDYALGEDATEYANDVLRGADGKWLVMSGVADDQIYAAVRDGNRNVRLLSMRRDDLYRRHLVRTVRAAFTNDVELVAAAQIGPQAFLAAARKRFPDLLVMADMDRTLAKIEKARPAEGQPKEPSVRQLADWNNEMVRAMDAGETDRAGRIARSILSVPKWRGFVPAHAILGTLTGMEGDLVASERFFRTVVSAEGDLPPVACNDFAETLRRLKKFDEAEQYARRAVAATDAKNWMTRLTLAQVLVDAGRDDADAAALIRKSLPYVPEQVKPRFREVLGQVSRRTPSSAPSDR